MSESDVIRCDVCGRVLSEEEVIQVQHHRICGACKPEFVQRLKEGVAEDISFRGSLNRDASDPQAGRIVIDLDTDDVVAVPSTCPVTGEEGVHQHQVCRLSLERDVHLLVSDIGLNILRQTALIRGTIKSLWGLEFFLLIGLIGAVRIAMRNLMDSTWVLASTFLCVTLFGVGVVLLFLRLEDVKPPFTARFVYGDEDVGSLPNCLRAAVSGCQGAKHLVLDFQRADYARELLAANERRDNTQPQQ